MKGLKRCYGLLLVLAIIFGLSLSASSHVSALEYAYSAFPILPTNYIVGSNYNPSGRNTYEILFKSSSGNFDMSLPQGSYTASQYISATNRCGSTSTSDIFWQAHTSNRYDLYTHASGSYFRFKPVSAFTPVYDDRLTCLTSSFSYDYDSIYVSDINMSNGIPTKLASLTKSLRSGYEPYMAGTVYKIQLPFSVSYDNVGTIKSGTPLEWRFGLTTKGEMADFSSNPTISASVNYFASDPSSSSDPSVFYNSYTSSSLSCSWDSSARFEYWSAEEAGNLTGVSVVCTLVAPSDMSYIEGLITLSANDNLFSYNSGELLFGGSYFITDNDDTWSGQLANDLPTGDNLSLAPGYSSLYGESHFGSSCNPGDWECDLSNLFGFNFINPFRPIFNLFSDQNQCAQIPTLASMIHSEETQVCPWFDSNTRNIVTPVVGLSSMMLLFGFAVRWLGARSGNFIEDSGGIDSGGYHFENKFRRKR